jgi:hypothetical protein
MSDNNIDKMMKSMLEDAQEEVPAHLWDGVSAGLDKAAKRAATIIWWRRVSAGVAAAAAVVAGVFLFGGQTVQVGQQPEEMVAVVEKPVTVIENSVAEDGSTPAEQVLMAEAETPKTARPAYKPTSVAEVMNDMEAAGEASAQPVVIEETLHTTEEVVAAEEPLTAKEPVKTAQDTKSDDTASYKWNDDVDWGEDEQSARTSRTSLVLSGITGTNNLQNGAKANIMKRPSIVAGPAQTGITETSTNTTYGIPVSVGAGVKISLNDRWSLGVGANYSLLTRKFYGTYTKAENGLEVNSTSSDIRNLQHFVGIPVNAYYNILNNKHINLYAYAGGTVEKCIADKYEVLSTSITHTEKPAGVQLSANIGLGVEFMLGRHVGLYADPSLRYYFDNGQPKSIRTAQPLMLGLDLGLRIKL